MPFRSHATVMIRDTSRNTPHCQVWARGHPRGCGGRPPDGAPLGFRVDRAHAHCPGTHPFSRLQTEGFLPSIPGTHLGSSARITPTKLRALPGQRIWVRIGVPVFASAQAKGAAGGTPAEPSLPRSSADPACAGASGFWRAPGATALSLCSQKPRGGRGAGR